MVTKVQQGKLVEVWRFMNGAAFARQLGLMPAPESSKQPAAAAGPAAPPVVGQRARPVKAQPASDRK
jgi:hypothetical protein